MEFIYEIFSIINYIALGKKGTRLDVGGKAVGIWDL